MHNGTHRIERPGHEEEDVTSEEETPTARELQALESDSRLRELGGYVPPLSMLRAFGVDRGEVAHSRALAHVLDPACHRNAGAALSALVQKIARQPGLDEEVASALRDACGGPWTRVAVHRERMRIDVVVEVASSRGSVVVGIENKIDAGEQKKQLARYQAALARAYPDRTAVLAFLTPTGREPTTALEGAAVPVVALDYGAVLSALGEAHSRAPSGSRDERVLREFEDHVREDILGEREDDEAKALARELWRTHGRALRFAMEHRPRLADVREEYVSLLSERYPDAYFDYYPGSRANLREIKMNLSSWDERGFPFTFMLETNGRDGEPRVRALIWRENFEKYADSLAAWARRANASGDAVLDEDFSPIRAWGWHKILRQEDHPEDAALEENAFDSETVRAAFDAVVELVELLRPSVENA